MSLSRTDDPCVMSGADSFESLVQSGAQGHEDVLGHAGNAESSGGPTSFGENGLFGLDSGLDDLFGAQTIFSHADSKDAHSEEATSRAKASTDAAVSISDYNRVLFEARLQDVGDAELKLPWEVGVMKDIFADDDMSVAAP